MLTFRTRRNASLVLFIGLMVTTALFWSLNSGTEAGLVDGVYTGKAEGFMGEIVVDVTISSGNMTDISVKSHSDTPGIAEPAFETLSASILEAQGTEVDTVSGATFSSNGFIEAVGTALTAAGGYEDGVYEGKAEGFMGDITVEVTVEDGAIAKVDVVDHSDTPGISDSAIDVMPGAIVEAQSADVDTVSGATYTSEGIINAVKNALGL